MRLLPVALTRPHTFLTQQIRDTQLREAGAGAPRCHFHNTFFVTKLLNLEADPPLRGKYQYKNVSLFM